MEAAVCCIAQVVELILSGETPALSRIAQLFCAEVASSLLSAASPTYMHRSCGCRSVFAARSRLVQATAFLFVAARTGGPPLWR
eukprot:3437445-Pleurochrysis_carterae.AAC.1